MHGKLCLALAAAFSLFSPAVFAEQQYGDRSKPQNAPVPIAPAVTDNVSDIMTFEKKLGLTGQQVVSLRLISADARLETSKRLTEVQECQQKLAKSLNESNPDFADIRARLAKLTEAQARAAAVPVDAYEKAYALLTDTQKTKLAFFKALRQQEIEKKAAEAAREAAQPQTPPPSLDTLSPSPAFGR